MASESSRLTREPHKHGREDADVISQTLEGQDIHDHTSEGASAEREADATGAPISDGPIRNCKRKRETKDDADRERTEGKDRAVIPSAKSTSIHKVHSDSAEVTPTFKQHEFSGLGEEDSDSDDPGEIFEDIPCGLNGEMHSNYGLELGHVIWDRHPQAARGLKLNFGPDATRTEGGAVSHKYRPWVIMGKRFEGGKKTKDVMKMPMTTFGGKLPSSRLDGYLQVTCTDNGGCILPTERVPECRDGGKTQLEMLVYKNLPLPAKRTSFLPLATTEQETYPEGRPFKLGGCLTNESIDALSAQLAEQRKIEARQAEKSRVKSHKRDAFSHLGRKIKPAPQGNTKSVDPENKRVANRPYDEKAPPLNFPGMAASNAAPVAAAPAPGQVTSAARRLSNVDFKKKRKGWHDEYHQRGGRGGHGGHDGRGGHGGRGEGFPDQRRAEATPPAATSNKISVSAGGNVTIGLNSIDERHINFSKSEAKQGEAQPRRR